MAMKYKEVVGRLTLLLAEAMSNDDYLPLPRESKEGEPTNWVAMEYPQGEWIRKEKLLLIPAIQEGLLVGIVECDPEQTKIKSQGIVECNYIVDAMDTNGNSTGLVLVAGTRDGKDVLLRVDGRGSSVDQELKAFLAEHVEIQEETLSEDDLDAFSGFLAIVLSQKTAFGIPLETTEESLEETRNRCLNQLYANMIISYSGE